MISQSISKCQTVYQKKGASECWHCPAPRPDPTPMPAKADMSPATGADTSHGTDTPPLLNRGANEGRTSHLDRRRRLGDRPEIGRLIRDGDRVSDHGAGEAALWDSARRSMGMRIGSPLGQRQAGRDRTAALERHSREKWTLITHLLIIHGRTICKAQRPDCPRCPVRHLCPWPHKTT